MDLIITAILAMLILSWLDKPLWKETDEKLDGRGPDGGRRGRLGDVAMVTKPPRRRLDRWN